jgi:glucose-6-phosphate dehydrogenase assembly protein OpcA
MNIDLANTTTRKIQDALTDARHRMGGPATGMVLTLIIVTDEAAQYDAVRAAADTAREHPCRIITVIARGGRGDSRLDAEIRIGENGPGETVLLRMYGELAAHSDAVVSPLLVTDTPVVTWWPGKAPKSPSTEPLGMVAQRRVTDATGGNDPLGTLAQLGESYKPGDTDFAWTRLTPWRTLLAAALDQPHPEITSASVEAEQGNPSAGLLAGWLAVRLGVPVSRSDSDGPGVTTVKLATAEGDLEITRPDGRVATLTRPDQPDRQAALLRRPTPDLLAEELRRLDPDEIYRESVSRYAKQWRSDAAESAKPAAEPEPESAPAPAKPAAKAAPKSRKGS